MQEHGDLLLVGFLISVRRAKRFHHLLGSSDTRRRRSPLQFGLGQRANIRRIDSAPCERLYERIAIALAVVRIEPRMNRDQRPQEVAELEVDRGTELDGADAQLDQLIGHQCRFPAQSLREIRMQLAAIVGRDPGQPEKVARTARVHAEERLEDRGHQNRAPAVRLLHLLDVALVRLLLADRRAQRPASSEGFPELQGEVDERVALECAADQLSPSRSDDSSGSTLVR
jgi:hypothetical protein